MFKQIGADIRAMRERDPAARSALEIILCYPGFWARLWHRFSHFLWIHHLKLLGRMISTMATFFTGIEIHPGAVIGSGLFIDHGSGVVVGETAIIGNNVTIYQGVTLGGTGKDVGKRHPTIEDDVVIGAGAKVLGPFTVGAGAKIGAGAIVLKPVDPGCTVVGNPGRAVRCPGQKNDLNQINLPDPIAEKLVELQNRIDVLEARLNRIDSSVSEPLHVPTPSTDLF